MRYHCCSCLPQPSSWALTGSSPMGTTVCPQPMMLTAQLPRWADGAGGDTKVVFLHLPAVLFQCWSVTGCSGREGGCWQWVKTGVLPSEERNWGFQITHFSQCRVAEPFRHPATNVQSGSWLAFCLFRLPLKDLPKLRKRRQQNVRHMIN